MNATILVVDDDKDARFVAQHGLLARGYTVLETGDPQQAIRMAKDQTIHLLLADVVMPIMKGPDWPTEFRPSIRRRRCY
jgi:CheY-like chemotaxis protein